METVDLDTVIPRRRIMDIDTVCNMHSHTYHIITHGNTLINTMQVRNNVKIYKELVSTLGTTRLTLRGQTGTGCPRSFLFRKLTLILSKLVVKFFF